MLTKFYALLATYIFTMTAASRSRVATRGANFIEYALLATIAVVVFLILQEGVRDVISETFGNVLDAVTN